MFQRFLAHTAAGVDRALLHALAASRGLKRAPPPGPPHAQRLAALRELAAVYSPPEHILEPARFFPSVAVDPTVQVVERTPARLLLELRWQSVDPFSAGVREAFLRHPANHTAAARLYTVPGSTGRPTVVLVHGYLGGHWRVEARVWPVAWLLELGLDVALFVLPFHGVRAIPGRAAPPFPSGRDPRLTLEGFRQAVADLRALKDLLHRRGSPVVGLMGMSLGGYASTLAATLDDYDFLVPMIPLGSLAEFAAARGSLVGAPEERLEQQALVESAFAVINPLARPSRTPPERTLVLTGVADHITPSRHTALLAEHLGAPVHTFHGGHLLQFGREQAFRAVQHMLERTGVIPRQPRPAPRRSLRARWTIPAPLVPRPAG